jgi:hypothetical protein
MKLFLRIWLLLLSAAIFTACGGGGGGDGDPSLTPDEDNTGGDPTNSTNVRFGISSGGSFQDGTMSATSGELLTGDSTEIQVALVDENGSPVNTAAEVNFNSTCIAAGNAIVQPQTVTNINGLITTTYTNNGCTIEDNIIANTTINGTALSASVSIINSSDTPGDGGNQNGDTSIQFGTFSGGQFQNGQIKANFTEMQPGDTVSIEVSFIDVDGLPFSGEASVNFNSSCISAGLANITPSTATNTNGLIQAEYVSNGCNGEDQLIAIASVDDTTLAANVILTTTFNSRFGSYVGGIFNDGVMTPSARDIKTGDTTSISVLLESTQGNPVAGNEVRFSSSNCVGSGLANISSVATTNASGLATTDYTANGCDGEDIVVAETRYAGQNLTATVTLNIDALEVRLGSFDQLVFNEGSIASSNNDIISAGESTTLSVAFLDQNDQAYIGDANVFFNSACLESGLAEIDPAIATNTDGLASVTYTSRGCDGSDMITASTVVASNTLTSSTTLNTDQPPLGTIQFISATPQIIGLKGTESINDVDNEDSREIGAQSAVVFKVTSSEGNPLPNQTVNFALVTGDSGAGNSGSDAFLSTASASSDADGLVSTVVNPGTNAIPIRVRATTSHEGADTSALSNSLVITTGIPDQDSISLSASCLNPDAWAYNGVTSIITAHLADRFNNPVPDGTSVTFRTEGGAIEASCNTGIGSPHGECSVEWRSQSPRPTDGRLTILATAIGEESFADVNPSNGRFEDSEFSAQNDIGEPFLDDNENGNYGAGAEQFMDFNLNGLRDGPNGLYDGLLCDNTSNTLCNTASETLFVSDDIVLVMADATSLEVELRQSPSPLSAPVSSIDLSNGGITVYAHVYDARNQLPSGGTTISATTDVGSIVGPSSYTVPSTNSNAGRFVAAFAINPADDLTEAENGIIEINVTSGTCAAGTPTASITIGTSANVGQSPAP